MDILALDFDGVICDSAGEAAVAGWKGAARIWPGRFAGDPPDEIIEKFKRVRPVMETGYESILLVRLLRDSCPLNTILEDSTLLFARLMRDESMAMDELVRVFGKTRDAWMSDDLQGWWDTHDFYSGTVNAVNQSDVPAYIITTKETRFVISLCHAIDLRISAENIFGLESGPKQDVLVQLSKCHPRACFHFVEDRLATLIEVGRCFDFDIRFYFARWGYHTENELDKAHKIPQIKVLTQDQFPAFVQTPSYFAV